MSTLQARTELLGKSSRWRERIHNNHPSDAGAVCAGAGKPDAAGAAQAARDRGRG
jgi:hypothetical protein